MSMQSVVSPANILTPAKRTSLTHIPGDEGWPIIGRTLAILADPKGEVERMAAKHGLRLSQPRARRNQHHPARA